jgi:two-component system, NarL family, nitrate/nitrite response regulator NarL
LIWLHPEFTAQLVGNLSPQCDREFLTLLSEREQEIVPLLFQGKTNHAIAEILQITPRTVKAHTSHIYHKLGVKDRLDFALRYK